MTWNITLRMRKWREVDFASQKLRLILAAIDRRLDHSVSDLR